MEKKREVHFYRAYFEQFFNKQSKKIQNKILWTLKVIEELDRIPEQNLRYVKNTARLYEIRVQVGNDIFRVFCFFDCDNLIVVGHGFQKKTPKKEIESAESINIMKTKNKNLKTLDQFEDEKIGKRGTKDREEFESDYGIFKLGVLIQQAREEKGLTQEELAEPAGTNKAYISKLERDLKDIRFSTLQRIINEGLGGHLELSINFGQKKDESTT